MKILILLFFGFVTLNLSYAQGVRVSNTTGVIDSSVILDVASSSRGVLMPNVALLSKNNFFPIVSSPQNSLLIYNTAQSIPGFGLDSVYPGYYFWRTDITSWERIASGVVETLTYVRNTDSTISYIDENGNTTIIDVKSMIKSGETLTAISNTDSTISYIDEDGSTTVIDIKSMFDSLETLTSISNTDSTISYTDEQGITTIINVKAMLDSLEILTSINNTDSTISYIDEDGDTTVIDVLEMIDSLETLTAISNTDSTISYIDEDGDTTVIDVLAMIDSTETLTAISNTDSTISYIDEDGDTTVIDVLAMIDSVETLTAISNTDSTISYIDEDGDTTVIDVLAMIDSVETLTSISNTDSTISYIDEDGDTTVIDVLAIIDSVETLTAISNTDSTISYIDEDGDTTVIDVLAMIDSTETLTAISNTDSTISYIDEDGDTTVIDVLAMIDSVETLTAISNTDSTISYIDEDGDTTIIDVLAMIDSVETLTVISNTDSTISYIDEDGDTTVIDVLAMIDSVETLTVISNTDSTISYIDEDGDTTVIDVLAMIDSVETLTAISNTDSTISYIDEDGDTTVIDVLAMIDSVETLTVISNTDSTISYIDEDGDTTVIDVLAMIDSVETLTVISNTDSTISYIDEDGDTTVIDVLAMIDSVETLTVISNTDSTISYIDEDGDTTIVDVKAMVDSIETLTSIGIIGDTNLRYVDENGDTSNLDLSFIKDSSEWIDGSLVGLTSGNIYARKALLNGDTVVVTRTGRVGIGEINPLVGLHVNSTRTILESSQSNILVLKSNTSGTGILNSHTKDGFVIRNYDSTGTVVNSRLKMNSDGEFRFDANTDFNGLDDLIIDSLGNVSIGSTLPTHKLDVNGEARIRTINDTNLVDNILVSKANGEIQKIDIDTLLDRVEDHDWYGRISDEPADSIEQEIYTLGRVSIGTKAAAGKVHISDSGVTVLKVNSLNSGSGGAADIELAINNTNKWTIAHTGSNNRLNFLKTGIVGYVPLLMQDTSIGINFVGGAVPSERLDVNGGVRIRTIYDTNQVSNILASRTNGTVQKIAYDTLVKSLADSIQDADWYVQNTTNSSSLISDNIFTQGTVSIGIDTISNGNNFQVSSDQGGTLDSVVVVRRSGDVGIGTVSPTKRLTLRRNNGIMYIEPEDTIGAAGTTLNPGSTTVGSLIQASTGRHLLIDLPGNGGDDAIAFRTSFAGTSSVDTIAMVIQNNTMVGMGTKSPNTKLHIVSASDPLTVEGLQSGAVTDSIMTITSAGLVRKVEKSIITNTAIVTTAANLTLTNANQDVLVDASGAARTITLPTAVGVAGKQFRIKKSDATGNNVIVNTTGAETIDGAASQTTNIPFSGYVLVSDGANWFIFGRI